MPKLTKSRVDAAEPRANSYDIRDSEITGFHVRVLPSGTRVYGYQWRDGQNKWRRKKIGKHGAEMTCDKARDIARRWAIEILASQGPAGLATYHPGAAGGAIVPTMGDLHKRYLEEWAEPRKKPRSVLNDKGYWKNHILPHRPGGTANTLETFPVATVTRADISALHVAMAATPTNANRVFEVVRKAFNLAEMWGWRPPGTNPCKGVEKYPENKRKRYLRADEAGRLGAVIVQFRARGDGWRTFANMILLIIYTGTRLSEIKDARWEWLDEARGVLALPDTKSNESQDVLLPIPALELLAEMKAERKGDHPFIIPGKKAKRPLQETRRQWAAMCKAAKLENIHIHDLRHSFASIALDLTKSLPMVGGLLRHADPKTTARYAHLFNDPLRASSESTAGLIAAWLDGNVVSLEDARKKRASGEA